VSRERCGTVAARVMTTLLKLASLRHYCSKRCDTVATGAAALLQQALRRCCSSQQQRRAAHYATMASSSSARGNGRQGYAALQRWQVASAEIFFLLDSFKKRTKARQREKREGFESCFSALLVGKLLPVNSLLQR